MVERVRSLFTNNIRDSKSIAIKNLERAKKTLPSFDYSIRPYSYTVGATVVSVMFKDPTPCNIMSTPYTIHREEYIIGSDWLLVKYMLEHLTYHTNYSFKWEEYDFNDYIQAL